MTQAIAVAADAPPPPGLIEANLVVPRLRPNGVLRSRVLEQLDAARAGSLISIVAPAGYGKTTVLAQWAESSSALQAVAWLTVDESDNDPALLFSNIATAIGRLVPIGADVYAGIQSAGVPIRAVVGRLLTAMATSDRPLVLVIDESHIIERHEALDPLAEFVSHLPCTSRVVLAGRTTTDLPFPRWRALGMLLELGPGDLAMNEAEGAELVRHQAPGLPDAIVRGLVDRTEGWPALLALASMSASRRPRQTFADVRGVDSEIADFLRHEILDREDGEMQEFLLQTSILGHLNGAVCDAVGVGPRSGDRLRALARSTVLVDEYGGWYRYHPLLREFLWDELQERHPESVVALHRRAGAWFEANGALEESVEHAFAGNDLGRASRLIASLFMQYHWSGRRGLLRSWLGGFSDDELQRRPWLALLSAFEQLSAGNGANCERLLDLADSCEPEGEPLPGGASFESLLASLRSLLGLGGADRMIANATLAVETAQVGSPWHGWALWVLAVALVTSGDTDAADDALVEAIASAGAVGAGGMQYFLGGHRALLAIDRGDWALAGTLVAEHTGPSADAMRGYAGGAPGCVARARLAIRRGAVREAERNLLEGVAVRPLLAPMGGFGVACLIGLARAHLALDDPAGARATLVYATDILRRRPDLGVLPAQVEAIRAQIASLPLGIGGASTLTPAELRVLALLPYYLAFAEIGERLGVQATTVKSHALSIYGKLGASSRAEAVELAVAVGLLEPFPA